MREMKYYLCSAGVIALCAGSAIAGGIDRSGQGNGALFEKGRYLELSFGYVEPDVSGTDVAAFGGGSSGDVAGDFSLLGFSYKYDLNDKLSFALNIDQPFGADVLYGTGSVALGNTIADADATAVTGLLRYKFNESFSVHGGLRAQRSEGFIQLRGLAYGALNGYNVSLNQDTGVGYVIGVAFEKPEIALRVALTYNSTIDHEFDTIERVGAVQIAPGSVTETKTPQSVNLDFQTGIAANTLLFGGVRWVDWSQLTLTPAAFGGATGGATLIEIEDTITYTLGVGRKFNDTWSGAFSLTYEDSTDPLTSPLAPTDGRFGASLAAIYTKDNMKITAGINYTKLGDAQPETGTPDTARANFVDNTLLGIGVKVGFSF
jgi:long-chain fatty acid transport protein